MADIQSKSLMVIKGGLFLCVALLSSIAILLSAPSWENALLLLLLAWSSARFYYFLFYVLERYVDPRLRYAGLLALWKAARGRRSSR